MKRHDFGEKMRDAKVAEAKKRATTPGRGRSRGGRQTQSWRILQELAEVRTAVKTIQQRSVEVAKLQRELLGLQDRLTEVKKQSEAPFSLGTRDHESQDRSIKLENRTCDFQLVENSGLVDLDWYYWRYGDVIGELDPAAHYLQFGSSDGCQPNPLFDGAWYLKQYIDVATADINPLVHYLRVGAAEGRNPHPLFYSGWYLSEYPDVAKAGINPLAHYLKHGAAEGRNPNPLFDGKWYLAQYSDVSSAGINPLVHYVTIGSAEGCNPHPLFDSAWYLSHYADVARAGMNPLAHYLNFGAREGRDPSSAASERPDLIASLRSVKNDYQLWIKQFDTLTEDDRGYIRTLIARFDRRPRLSILMPVFNIDVDLLRRSINSVIDQLYEDWELCISDDASTNPRIKQILNEYSRLDKRVLVTFRRRNGHISANSNSALNMANGEFVVLMDADDELPEHALFWVAYELQTYPKADLIYSDEDKIGINGERSEPYFKPDWNPALITSQNFFSHLGVYRRALVKKAGGFRRGFEGSQDHDLVLRCTELTTSDRIRHIPRILYHWRIIPGSTAFASDAKPYAWQAGARAIAEHLDRCGTPGVVRKSLSGYYQVAYQNEDYHPTVSIVVPTAFKQGLIHKCVESVLLKTTYPNFEMLIALHTDIASENRDWLRGVSSDNRVKILEHNEKFNYSKINNWAITQASGNVICLLNDDTELSTADWLDKLVARLASTNVAAVGPLLLYPNNTIQHAGIILGLGGIAGHPFKRLPMNDGGYFGRAALEQDLSCVTAACMAIKREVFISVGGFNERFVIAFNDVDLCLRVREAGWRILWTPAVQLYHHESASIGQVSARSEQFHKEIELMRELWGEKLFNDPFYNPNLSLTSLYSDLCFPPRQAKLPPWTSGMMFL